MPRLLVLAIITFEELDRERIILPLLLVFAIAIIRQSGTLLVFYLFVVFFFGDGSLESIVGPRREVIWVVRT
jgi:hypothetical protein